MSNGVANANRNPLLFFCLAEKGIKKSNQRQELQGFLAGAEIFAVKNS